MTSREAKLQVTRQALGPWGTNTYVLVCPDTGKSVLLDPAAEPETLLA